MWARPVCGWIRASASVASGSSSSMSEMSFAAARLSPVSKSETRAATGSRGRDAGPFRAGTGSPTVARGLEERHDVPKRRAGTEDHPDARPLQFRHVIVRDDPPARDHDVARLSLLQKLHDLREQRHVGPAQA